MMHIYTRISTDPSAVLRSLGCNAFLILLALSWTLIATLAYNRYPPNLHTNRNAYLKKLHTPVILVVYVSSKGSTLDCGPLAGLSSALSLYHALVALFRLPTLADCAGL